MARLIVASAAYFESVELAASLRALGYDVTQVTTGIGLVEASLISSRLRDVVEDRHVIFCCTGGLLGEFHEVQVFQATTVKLAPHDIRTGNSYLLSEFDPEIQLAGLPLSIPFCEAVGSVGVSTVKHDTPTEQLALETLELYSVARAWQHHARTFTAIIASTNAVGPNAHAEWKRNYGLAATLTAKLVAEKFITEVVKAKVEK